MKALENFTLSFLQYSSGKVTYFDNKKIAELFKVNSLG